LLYPDSASPGNCRLEIAETWIASAKLDVSCLDFEPGRLAAWLVTLSSSVGLVDDGSTTMVEVPEELADANANKPSSSGSDFGSKTLPRLLHIPASKPARARGKSVVTAALTSPARAICFANVFGTRRVPIAIGTTEHLDESSANVPVFDSCVKACKASDNLFSVFVAA